MDENVAKHGLTMEFSPQICMPIYISENKSLASYKSKSNRVFKYIGT